MIKASKPIPSQGTAQSCKRKHVFIDLTDDPSWRYTVQQGLMDYTALRQQTHGSIIGMRVSPKLLLEPAVAHCRTLTGEDVIGATTEAFDVDQFKTGAMRVSRDYVTGVIQPLCAHFLATANVSHKHRFGVRQAVLSCLFLYANSLRRHGTRERRIEK